MRAVNVIRRVLPVVVVVAVVAAALFVESRPERDPRDSGPAAAPGTSRVTVAEAFAARQSDVWVEESGTVVALLRDDLEGSRHQKFLLRLGDGATLLVSHNIDLAPRVPVEKGDEVTVRGEYVWNDKGGLVHWTHHDPNGRLEGGWIRHAGREYR